MFVVVQGVVVAMVVDLPTSNVIFALSMVILPMFVTIVLIQPIGHMNPWFFIILPPINYCIFHPNLLLLCLWLPQVPVLPLHNLFLFCPMPCSLQLLPRQLPHGSQNSSASFHVTNNSQNIQQSKQFDGLDNIYVGNGEGLNVLASSLTYS